MLTLHDPMDCSLPGSSVYGIFQARVLEWGAIAFSRRDLGAHQINPYHSQKKGGTLGREGEATLLDEA